MPKPDLREIVDEIISWGNTTFPQESVHSLATHIGKEALELQAKPTNALEIADVLMLTFALAAKAGIDPVEALLAKLRICRTREWLEPDEHGVTHRKKGGPGSNCPDCGSMLIYPAAEALGYAVRVHCLNCQREWWLDNSTRCHVCWGAGRVHVNKPSTGGLMSTACQPCSGTGEVE